MAGTFIVLGCGYIGARAARAALAAGRPVRVCSRHANKLEPLHLLGAEVRTFDAAKIRSFGPALQGAPGATVLYAVPPVTEIPSGESLARATEAALHIGARSFIYLSSAGLYGDMPDEEWVDEETTVVHDDPAMSTYHTDESAVESASFAGLRTATLRLAAVYGVGRGVRQRLRAGDYKLLDGGKHFISRIHVDDLVRIIFAAEERAPQGALYVVGDDRPSTQKEYAEWLTKRLGLPMPPSVASYAPGMRRTAHRGRRIRNAKMKSELGVELLYPSYVEGEQQIEREEAGDVSAASPPPPPTTSTPTAPAPSTTASTATAMGERPPFVKNVAEVPAEEWSYPGRSEKHGKEWNLGDAVGITQFGLGIVELAPGRRSGLPHAHSAEDEIGWVMDGTPDLWVDGKVYRLRPGDLIGFPAGTGISHILINNTQAAVKLLVAGSRKPGEDRVCYPTDPARQAELKPERLWSDAPKRELGPHDGKPGS